MSRRLNLTSPLPLFIFVAVLLLFGSVACSDASQAAVAQAAAAVSNEVDEALTEPDTLVFAGQVEDENGRWLNNRVVILFKNGEEVDRTTTRMMESAFSNEGPMDGVFELKIRNDYKLSVAHEFYYQPTEQLVDIRTRPGLVGTRYLGTWHASLNPDDMLMMEVPSKQLEYAVVVLSMPADELPDTHQRGRLSFQHEDSTLVIEPEPVEEEAVAENATAVTETAVSPPPESGIVVTLFINNGQPWNMRMHGYYGTRWDVWERFVAGQGSGMSWETFKEAVLDYNPHLVADGYVFHPDKFYWLPSSQ